MQKDMKRGKTYRNSMYILISVNVDYAIVRSLRDLASTLMSEHLCTDFS